MIHEIYCNYYVIHELLHDLRSPQNYSHKLLMTLINIKHQLHLFILTQQQCL